MKERLVFGYDPFVLPFLTGMIFIIGYLLVGTIRIIICLNGRERKRLLTIFHPATAFRIVKDIFADCLLHIKIFKRNVLLGYMHASIAFGWFMLIVLGHIEVMLFTPQRNGILYYPIFFRYFVMETEQTLRGSFYFFVMDLCLLIVLSGIGLAIYKRFKSHRLGMKRTTKLRLGDNIALYSLWLIFPLRLLAESFTADISGGSFLTKGINSLLHSFVSNPSNISMVWWAYSSALGLFFFALPFSRYMHIPTEILLIALRHAKIEATSLRDGYSEAEIYSCSRCGICIDACPMTFNNQDVKFTSVYYIRLLRRRENASVPAGMCLMCNKCVELCPVGIDSTAIKLINREILNKRISFDYTPVNLSDPEINLAEAGKAKLLYYGGCMTALTPSVSFSIFKILEKAGIEYIHMDKENTICCGRPLLLSGNLKDAKELISKNRKLILDSGCQTLLVSCPICYKMFTEEYDLKNIRVVHHSVYINELINNGEISVKKSADSCVYHDPCELGRGSGIYDQPRSVLESIMDLKEAPEEKRESICCGGSLGSIALSYNNRKEIAKGSLNNLMRYSPDILVTSCPLCLRTFSSVNEKRTADIAQVVYEHMI
ncbi:MAG: (Fe-S)-binding protein [Bacteroidales bacterium]|nr:(Fe-S)-binding protein [Bacteroidales bacterium]MDD2424473.1 (Fe-S)-binding protein [Bacteroidales bacterium]MDD3988545.1 (Fe-S)-binding protein [Bacteroidales bacterium]